MNTAFQSWISPPLQRLCSVVPNITVIMMPSVRDAVSKHVSWPQEQLPRKDLGLPKQVKMLPNPCTISLNETVIGISSQDILYELSREQISGGSAGQNLMTRLPRFLIEQRHFYPLFPPVSRDQWPKGSGPKATGACLDLGYLKLGEWLNVRPDVLVVPSVLTPSVKVSRFPTCQIPDLANGIRSLRVSWS
jgi:DNA polymerase alpha subunit B